MKKSNKKILAVSAISIALVLSIGLFAVAKADSTFLDKVAQYAGTFLGKDLSQKIGDLTEQSFGALSGPIIPYDYFGFGDVIYMASPQTMQLATTTLCSIPNPFTTGTSTLIDFSYQITVGTSTAATMVIATSSKQYATSSVFHLSTDRVVASGVQDSAKWIQKDGVDDWIYSNSIIGPNEYVLLQTVEAGLSGYTYTGKCKATFRSF